MANSKGPQRTPLPIDALLGELCASLGEKPNAVLVAPPGAGKTTRVPPAIAAMLAGEETAHRSIVMLQPRRVAARAAAARIAEEHDWILGREVGYQIRFENKTSATTRVHVLTEGILLRRIQSDPFLEGVGCVLLDEFHERSIHTDLALALLKEIQGSVRPDLRIVVMSATMDPEPVAGYLGAAPIFRSEGRLYPVEVSYTTRADQRPLWERAAEAVRSVAGRRDSAGHILVFLPGIGEIRRVADATASLGLQQHVLHSSVSSEEQDRALRPSPATKLILATNIAETSITIDGVDTVIDGGMARVLVNNPRLGIDQLELRRISRASASQRAGRAGRTGPGRCLRLWTRQDDASLEPQESPEIHRIDLASAILGLHDYGIRDVRAFDWYEAPKEDSLLRAETLLRMLGAIDAAGAMTKLGERLAALPLHPRLARLLLAGAEAGLAPEAATIAAILSEKDILARRPDRRATHPRWEGMSDILDRLEMIEGEASPHEVDRQAVRNVLRIRDQLMRLVRDVPPSGRRAASNDRTTALLRIILQGFPDRVTTRRVNDPTRGVMVGNRGVVLEAECTVRRPPFFLALDTRNEPGSPDTRVALASAIEADWLAEDFPHLVQRVANHEFDQERQRVVSTRRTLFCDLLLREDAINSQDDPGAVEQAMRRHLASKAPELFHADEDAAALLRRIRFAAHHVPSLGLPSLDDEGLRSVALENCEGCRSLADLKKRGLRSMLENALPWQQRQALDRAAPETIKVPSGTRARLQYAEDLSSPILAVRLQELFGLAETPRIAEGRVPIVIQLLGPNFRPVQITSDLRSFWNGTYQEVRKELRARYPKHPWPEDPWNAPPVAVGRRRSH